MTDCFLQVIPMQMQCSSRKDTGGSVLNIADFYKYSLGLPEAKGDCSCTSLNGHDV